MDVRAFYEEMCFTVCLYGIGLDHADIVPLVGEVDEFFRAAGQPTSHLTVTGRGFGKMPLLYDGAWKRLQRAVPTDLVSIGMYLFVEDWVTQSDWIVASGIDMRLGIFDLGTGLSAMTDAEPRIMGFARRWMDRMRPAYGIGFHRERRLGPDGYSIGLPCSDRLVFEGPAYEEQRAVQRWGEGMDEAVYDQGVLRDVYPYSILTARHLERAAADGLALGDWIRAAAWRGELAAFTPGYTLWTVAPENLARVRKLLACAGALYVLERDNHL